MTMPSCSRSSTSGPPSAWCGSSRARPARASAPSSSRPVGDRAIRVSWLRRSPRRKRGVPSGSGLPDRGGDRELRDSAEMFEAALAENPEDLTVLEALREIYTRLGDIERLMETVERIERLDSGQSGAGGRHAEIVPPPAPAPPRAPAPSRPTAPPRTIVPP